MSRVQTGSVQMVAAADTQAKPIDRERLEAYARLFDALKGETRDAAFDLLRHARETLKCTLSN